MKHFILGIALLTGFSASAQCEDLETAKEGAKAAYFACEENCDSINAAYSVAQEAYNQCITESNEATQVKVNLDEATATVIGYKEINSATSVLRSVTGIEGVEETLGGAKGTIQYYSMDCLKGKGYRWGNTWITFNGTTRAEVRLDVKDGKYRIRVSNSRTLNDALGWLEHEGVHSIRNANRRDTYATQLTAMLKCHIEKVQDVILREVSVESADW